MPNQMNSIGCLAQRFQVHILNSLEFKRYDVKVLLVKTYFWVKLTYLKEFYSSKNEVKYLGRHVNGKSPRRIDDKLLKFKNNLMLSLTSVSVSEVVIGDVADKFKLPCQRVHEMSGLSTVTVCRRPDSNRRWLTPVLKATDLDHALDQHASSDTHRSTGSCCPSAS